MNRLFTLLLATSVLLAAFAAHAAQLVPDAPPEAIASALTSGRLGLTIGAALVLASWLLARVRQGVPLLEQLKHAWSMLRPMLAPSIGAAGALLLVGATWRAALQVALVSLFMAAGLSAKPRAPTEAKPS